MPKNPICSFCKLSYWKSRGHECPDLFVHKTRYDKKESKLVEITIKGKDLDFHWKGNKIFIYPEGPKR